MAAEYVLRQHVRITDSKHWHAGGNQTEREDWPGVGKLPVMSVQKKVTVACRELDDPLSVIRKQFGVARAQTEAPECGAGSE